MNLAELQEVNKKLPKASKNEIAAALNRLGVNPDSIKVGDKLKFPAEINEFNGTITKGVVNGNTFFQVAVEVNGVARNVSINSLFRSFNDRENNVLHRLTLSQRRTKTNVFSICLKVKLLPNVLQIYKAQR